MPLHVSIVSVKNYKYIRVYSSYRNEKGQPRSRLIENHGRLDTALSKDPQYVEKLKERIAKENRLEASTKAQEVEKQAKERMDKLSQAAQGLNDKPGCFKTYNVGAALIRKVWSDLKLPEMFRHLQRSRKIGYSYDQTAYLLTEQRLLQPTSKLRSFANRSGSIIDHAKVDHLEDLYKVLDLLQEDKATIVRHLNKEIQKKTKRKVTAAFYDVTTYSFESRCVSDYKDFGISKDHKVNEVQVVLGLVMDENGIPIDYELFNGNTNEFGTMVPLIEKIKKTYHLKQLIVVADRGLNSCQNLFDLKDIGCDFVIAGVKYGITEGMDREIHTANMLGIAVIDANQIKRHLEYEEKRQERVASDYAKLHKCKHCYECRLCSLMGYKNCCTASACTAAYKRAYEYALSRIRERQET